MIDLTKPHDIIWKNETLRVNTTVIKNTWGVKLYKIHYECSRCGMTTDYRQIMERHVNDEMDKCIEEALH